MKKSLITLAVLAASGSAMAQSSVTLFGIVDATVRYVDADKGGSVVALTNSGMYGSRLGFRGTEDLGGGLNASFWLEAGLNNDNGSWRLHQHEQQHQHEPGGCIRLARPDLQPPLHGKPGQHLG